MKADQFTAGRDPNCGAAFWAAVKDTILGFAYGCSQTNPIKLVEVPTVQPVCF